MGKKLYLIGMDAVPLWILKEFSDQRGMSPFKRLLDKDLIRNMESTLPPMTGPAWPSIYTGLEPGEHGVPDFFVMKWDYTPDLVYYDSEKMPPFWHALSEHGLRSLIITPATDIILSRDRNVDMITGFPLKSRANSSELEGLMKKHDFNGEPDIEKDMKDGKMGDEEAAPIFAGSIRKRSKMAMEMLEKKSYDFVFVCFTETDRFQHFVLNKRDMGKYLLPLYREIAEFLGYVLNRADKENASVMLVSDHGAQPIKKKFLLNGWLIQNGFAYFNKAISDAFEGKGGVRGPNPALYKMREVIIKSRLRGMYDKMPHGMKKAVFKTLGSVKGAYSEDYLKFHLFDMNMNKTKAFAAISNDPVATIWINDKRFENGFVKESEKKELKDRIIRELKLQKAEDGGKLVVNVWDGDKYYKGTSKFIAPDIMIEVREGYTVDITHSSRSTFFMDPEGPKSGDHIRNGIFGFYSKNAKIADTRISVYNVAPTILDFYGIDSGRLRKNSILRKLGK